MRDPRDILLRPVISEKASHMAADKVYTFKVHPEATKPQIKDAVEQLFGVSVGRVNVLNRRGTSGPSLRSRRIRKRPGYKRAMVFVVDGEIDLYGI